MTFERGVFINQMITNRSEMLQSQIRVREAGDRIQLR